MPAKPPPRQAASRGILPSMFSRLVKPRPVRGGRHRDVQGSAARAGVLGAGDGLITNISLILGVAGASTSTTAVRVAGIAGLLAGAFSMAAGELVSVRAHDDLVKHEIDVERDELSGDPVGEQWELAGMYRARASHPRTQRLWLESSWPIPTLPSILTHGSSSVSILTIRLVLAGSCGVFLLVLGWSHPPASALVLHHRNGRGRYLRHHRGIGCRGPRGSHRLILRQGVWRTAGWQLLAAVVAASVTYGVGRLLR